MIFPTLLLLSLPFLAQAAPQHSANPHVALAGRLVSTRDVAADCPTCTSFATTVSACVQFTSTADMGACLCTVNVFDDLNTCIECPAVASSPNFADLLTSSSQISTSCAQLGVTGLPAIDSLPPATASTSSPESDSAVASDAPSTTGQASNTIATTAAAGITTAHSGTTTNKAVASPTSKTSTKALSASVKVSSGFKSSRGSFILVGAAGIVGAWAASV